VNCGDRESCLGRGAVVASETGYVLSAVCAVQYVGDARCNSSASRFGLERGTVRCRPLTGPGRDCPQMPIPAGAYVVR
jgi:hypothetical protein